MFSEELHSYVLFSDTGDILKIFSRKCEYTLHKRPYALYTVAVCKGN
jgi:hypothetical protein